MTLRIFLTDGNGVQGLNATFGAYIQTNVVQTAADAAAAAASAAAALASQNAAAASATAAATSATASSNSASSAATSATNAGNSATAASGSAGAAATSATNAGNSATASAGSATAANTSATNAAASATAAATSASNAAATLANALTKANNLSDVANVTTARGNLSAAKSGANSDITSLTGLTTALSIAQGGTGATTATAALTNLGTQPSVSPTFTGNVGVPTRSASDSSANAASTAFVAAAIAPMVGKNRIINGDCRVAQRGSAAFAAGTSGYAGPDRFLAQNGGATGGQFTQSQGTITFGGIAKAAVVQTINTVPTSIASSNFLLGIDQRIEGFNCFDMIGSAAALSFIFNSNVSGTYSVRLSDYTGNNSFVSTFTATANTPVKISIPIASLPTALTTPNSAAGGLEISIGGLNTGTYQTSTLNSWQTGNFLTASGATNWAAAINNFIAVTDLQIESGLFSTPFERRPYGIEYFLCQRYFTGLGTVFGCMNGSGTASALWQLPTMMRATPTVTYTGTLTINAQGQATYTTTNQPSGIYQTAGGTFGFNITGLGTTVTTGPANFANVTFQVGAEL